MKLPEPQQFFDQIDLTRVYLARPSRFILLCGGQIDGDATGPVTARKLFLNSLADRNSFENHKIILAESINAFYPDSPYRNLSLIELEIDFARISDSVVLFSEGFGSLAELGAFSQIPKIAERMMVLMQSRHHEARSFIRDGPIRHLEQNHKESVAVFDWINKPGSYIEVDEASFAHHLEDIKQSIHDKLEEIPHTLKFDPDDFGHNIILSVAIADVLGAATFKDFKDAFTRLGVTIKDDSNQRGFKDPEIQRMLFCAVSVGWLKREQRGHSIYYLPVSGHLSCDFAYKPAAIMKDLMRWKRDIRQAWNTQDPLRFRLILDHPRGGSP